jgi:hypothetical protein
MLTGNNALITEFWNTHLALPMEQSIIMYEFFTQEKLTQLMSSEARRLLGIDDADTSVSTFVLLLNCLHGSGTRMYVVTNFRYPVLKTLQPTRALDSHWHQNQYSIARSYSGCVNRHFGLCRTCV